LLHRPGRGAMPALQHRLAALDLAHVQRFRAALGFAGPGLPLSYAYLLAQRAQLAAMLAPGFAHRIAGLVHVSNRLQRRAPLDHTQPLDLETQVQDEPERADGARFVTLDVALRQQGQVVLNCHSRYLARRRRAGERAPTPEPEATMPERAAWTLPQHAGRHYAALSGDWNPIHLWGWSARLFGLRQPIIHGAHSMARAQAELERLGGRPLQALALDFLRPVPLGSTVALHADPATRRFELRVAGRRAVAGAWDD
ncbi:MAG: hypothetical protein E6Q67_05355, partial [Roseateles sp.]